MTRLYTVRARYRLGYDGGCAIPRMVGFPTRAWGWCPRPPRRMFQVNYPGEGPKNLTDEQLEKNMRLALSIGDLPMTVHKITRWALEGVLAAKFREGRVFLVGDAAHRHPPTQRCR